jgi:hypothetical protein
MIKNTFRFWLMATLVLATVYLVSNPTMASKLGSQASRIWQVVISKAVKVPELVATITPAEQEELAEGEQAARPIWEQPKQVVRPIFEPPELEKADPKEEKARQQDEKAGRDDKRHKEVAQETQRNQPLVPEIKMEDVLTPMAEKPLAQGSGGPAVGEEAISLEILREIYARHLEALKIIDSGVGNEQADK